MILIFFGNQSQWSLHVTFFGQLRYHIKNKNKVQLLDLNFNFLLLEEAGAEEYMGMPVYPL